MAITAQQVLVKVGADTSSAKSGLGSLLGMLGPGGVVAAGAVAVGIAVAGIGVKAAQMAGDFQAGLTSLVTGAGESQKNLKMVSAGILQMANDTGTSTQQLIDGMYMIESGGYHGAAGLKVLQAAAEGAKVGNADLGVVADATDTILKNFGTTGLNANQAVNALIATVAHGKTKMEDLAGALSQVLPTAAASKVGLNDVMGAMATMTGEGVPAANAATYLRQTIIALDAPSSKAQKALRAIGLSSNAVATEMQKSLPGALKMIQDHLSRVYAVGSPQYVAALKDISGGSKQMQGMLDLTGNHLKTFQSNVSTVGDAVKKGGHSIIGWSEVQGTFNQKMDRAKEVVETLMIQLGTHLLPVAGDLATMFAAKLPSAINLVIGAITRIVSAGQGIITFFQDTGPASTLVKIALLTLAGAMLGMAASGIPALIVSIGESVTAFGAQTVAAGTAAIATLAAAAPFLIVGAAIGIAIGIIILAVTHWKQITEVLGHFKDTLGNLAGAIGSFVGGALGALGGLVQKGIAFFIDLEVKIPLAIAGMVLGVLGHIKDMAGNFIGLLVRLDVDAGQAIDKVVGAILGTIGSLPGKMLTLGGQIIQSLINGITGMAGNLKSAVGNVIGNIPGVGGLLSHLPGFADGGTMDHDGPAVVGEKGKEIVWLNKGSQVTPISAANTPRSPIVTGGSASSGGNQPIVLQVDGRTFARLIAPHLTQHIRSGAGLRVQG